MTKECSLKPAEVSEKTGRGRPQRDRDGSALNSNKVPAARKAGNVNKNPPIPARRGRGRPPGAVNIVKREILMSAHDVEAVIPNKRKRGRPSVVRDPTVVLPVKEPRTPLLTDNKPAEALEKRKRGRPFGSVKKQIKSEESISAQSLAYQKKRGRPKKIQLQLLNKPTDLTKAPATSVKGQKTNIVTGEKTKLKEKQSPIKRENKKVERKKTILEKKTAVAVKKKNIIQEKRKIMVGLKNIMKERKRITNAKSAKEATTTVVMEQRRRGRPKKTKQVLTTHDQVTSLCPNIFPENLKHEENHLQFISDFNPCRQMEPTDMGERGAISPGVDLSQISQKTQSPAVGPQSSRGSEDMVDEEILGPQTEAQTSHNPGWETKPANGVWTPEADSLENNSVTQWVVEETSGPPTRYSEAPVLEQHNLHAGLLHELSEFRTHLTRELVAMRGELREGRESMRSAISNVAAEINRLGQILQPLVSMITDRNMFCPQQNYPSTNSSLPLQKDLSSGVSQLSTDQINSSTHSQRNTPSAQLHLHGSPISCSGGSVLDATSPVKTEDLLDNPNPCIYQIQSTVCLPEDTSVSQSLLMPHYDPSRNNSMKLSHKIDSSTNIDETIDVPQPSVCHTNTAHSPLGESSPPHLSDHEDHAVVSVGSSSEVDSPARSDNCTDTSKACQQDPYATVPAERDSPLMSSALLVDDKIATCSLESNCLSPSPDKSMCGRRHDLSPSYSMEQNNKADSFLYQCLPSTDTTDFLKKPLPQEIHDPLTESITLLSQTEEISDSASPLTALESSNSTPSLGLEKPAANVRNGVMKEALLVPSENCSMTSQPAADIASLLECTCSLPEACPHSCQITSSSSVTMCTFNMTA